MRLGSTVKCIEPGDSDENASEYSLSVSIKNQGHALWQKVLQDPTFSDKFDIIGLSQGAMLARYILQYCPLKGQVRRFVSYGGPVNGVTGSITCFQSKSNWDSFMSNSMVYMFPELAPVSYWKDPTDIDIYIEHSPFLAEANNERSFNQTLKDSFLSLEKALFIKWEDDTIVRPLESWWWGEFDQDYNEIPRQETKMYKDDLIGIRTLEEQGRIQFASIPGDHGHVALEDGELVINFLIN